MILGVCLNLYVFKNFPLYKVFMCINYFGMIPLQSLAYIASNFLVVHFRLELITVILLHRQAGTSLTCLSSIMPKCRHEKVRNLVAMMAAQLKITQESACKKSKGCNFDRAMENMMAMKNAVDSPLVQMEGSPLSCRFVINQIINFNVVFINSCCASLFLCGSLNLPMYRIYL